MLGHIMKYDLKAQFKSLFPVYMIAFCLAIVVRIMSMLVEKVALMSSVYGFLVAVSIFSLVGVALWTAIVSIKYFYTNMLRDEGYLTNTLPVTRNQLIISKEICAILTMVVAVAVIIASIAVGYYHGGIKDFFTMISDQLALQGVDGMNFMIWMIVVMVVSYIAFIQMCFTSLMFGQTQNNNKIVFAIVFGIIIYVIRSIFSAISVWVDTFISPEIMKVVINGSTTNVGDIYEYVVLIFATSIVVTAISMVVMHCISVYLANHKLNLE